MSNAPFPRRFTEDFVLRLIQENQPISLYQIAKRLGYSYSGSRDYIRSLIEKGKLRTELKLNVKTNRSERLVYIN